jgi:PST family polysaccharide transporter
VRQSKDGKVLMENFLSLSLLQVAGYIFPLITLPYLARVIGVDKFGEIAFASSVIVYFQTVVDWGFNYTATRDVARCKNDIGKVSEIFCNVMGAKILLLIVSTVVFAICVYSIPFLYEKRLILWMTFLYVPGYLMFPDWFFQAIEKMKYITILNVISKILFTVAVFVFIKEKSDFILQPLFVALGFIISGIITMWIIFTKFKVRLIMPLPSKIIKLLRESFNMFISLLLPNLYTNFSVILLGVYGGSTATGIFSSGKRFIDLCEQFMQVLSRAFFPFLSRRMDKHETYVKISGWISIVMSIVLFVSADLLVKIFYSPEFSNSALVIRIMSIAPFFLFLLNTYGANYLVLQKKENILRNIVLFCSIIGFVLAWITILTLNYIGVAITIIVVWGIRGFLTWYYAQKIKKSKQQ